MVQQLSTPGGSGGHASHQHQQQQLARMQACVRSLLVCIQEDPSRQGLLDTPKVRRPRPHWQHTGARGCRHTLGRRRAWAGAAFAHPACCSPPACSASQRPCWQ
jgi:hypothetical protein